MLLLVAPKEEALLLLGVVRGCCCERALLGGGVVRGEGLLLLVTSGLEGLEAAMLPSMIVGTTLLVSRRGMTTPRLALPMKRLVVRLSSVLNTSPTSSPSSVVCGCLPSSLNRTRWRKQPLWRIVLLPSLMLLRVEARPACPCIGRLSRCSS